MKQGTVSVLVGCHSIIHSFAVWRAWCKLYGQLPNLVETICILLHDIGHWGKDYLDNLEEKKKHWELGAVVARKLFGDKGFMLVAGHCEYSPYPRSKLYKADKYSQYKQPYWWSWVYQTFEPKLSMGYTKREAWENYMKQVTKSIESGEYRGNHQMYLERCKGDDSCQNLYQ